MSSSFRGFQRLIRFFGFAPISTAVDRRRSPRLFGRLRPRMVVSAVAVLLLSTTAALAQTSVRRFEIGPKGELLLLGDTGPAVLAVAD